MAKRIMLSLDKDQYRIIKSLKGFGRKDAEIIRNVVIAYLSEKSYLKSASEKPTERSIQLLRRASKDPLP